MDVTLDRPIFSGTIEAIQSKSMAHRYLICAALADKETEIACRCYSDDIRATAECLSAMGADIERDENGFRVKPINRERQGSGVIRGAEDKGKLNEVKSSAMSLDDVVGKDSCDIGGISSSSAVEKVLGDVLGKVPGDATHLSEDSQGEESKELPCGESGSTLRFLLPVVVALGQKAAFLPQGRLPERPLSPLYEELERHGAALAPQGSSPFAVDGKLSGGKYSLAGNISSQFVTGLLFALILCEEDSVLELIEPVESKAYIDMTLDSLKVFGIEIPIVKEEGKDGQPGKWLFMIKGGQKTKSPGKVVVEADWSNAAFWLCAGALCPSAANRSATLEAESQRDPSRSTAVVTDAPAPCSITVEGLNMNSSQGDMAVVEVLHRMGATITKKTDADGLTAITVSGGKESLSGVEIDASGIPDLVPILALTATVAKGKTTVYNAGRLRIKESDRLNSVATVLNGLGADVTETEDGLIINSVELLKGGEADSFGDHRIVMMAAVAASVCEESVTITGAQAVNKSYPDFFEDAEQLNLRS